MAYLAGLRASRSNGSSSDSKLKGGDMVTVKLENGAMKVEALFKHIEDKGNAFAAEQQPDPGTRRDHLIASQIYQINAYKQELAKLAAEVDLLRKQQEQSMSIYDVLLVLDEECGVKWDKGKALLQKLGHMKPEGGNR